jgi:thioredoxin reductase (NADPH)
MDTSQFDVVIIGSGISGLSAAIYAGRAGHRTLVIKGPEPGGQLTLTTDVANYPGFPEGISGPELIQKMTAQAEQFGAKTLQSTVESIDVTTSPRMITLDNGETLTTRALIIASGASARTLGVPGEDELMGYGVSTCATCDGAFFNGKPMAVIGGGDAALEEATFLTKFASKVYLVHRRDEFRAEKIWQETVQEKVDAGEIELVLNTEVESISGTQAEGVETLELITHPEGNPRSKLDSEGVRRYTLDVDAVFIAIGHIPNTEYLSETGVVLDSDGYLQTSRALSTHETETGVDGLFGAGDVVDSHYQQAATAAGMGVKAALDADAYLSSL